MTWASRSPAGDRTLHYRGIVSWLSPSSRSSSRAVGNPFRAKFPPCVSGVVVLTGISLDLIHASRRRRDSSNPDPRVHREGQRQTRHAEWRGSHPGSARHERARRRESRSSSPPIQPQRGATVRAPSRCHGSCHGHCHGRHAASRVGVSGVRPRCDPSAAAQWLPPRSG